MGTINRRNFLRTSLIGGVAVAYARPVNAMVPFSENKKNLSSEASVAISTGDSRADLAFRALEPFSGQIKHDIGNRRVVLKPNLLTIDLQLAATHVDTLEGILEFLKSINKLDNVVIAESAAPGPTFEGYSNYGYHRLTDKYPVKLVDLDQEAYEVLYVFNQKDFKPHPVRFSRMMLSPDSYIVSVARMKTHNQSVVTLSLKNIIFGSPIKDIGFAFGPNRKKGSVTDKPIVHGGGYRGINYNMYALAPRLHPHLAVIDGYDGMEGNGPSRGTAVDHRVCVASTDWLAADRVAVELMGIDFAKVGYLNYCAQTGLGVADLDQIEIVGESIDKHIKPYKLHENIERQLIWMNPVS